MKKIKWSEEELKNKKDPYVICNTCGWMVTEPDENIKECANCGTKYKSNK